jgi:hypothetical protein
MNSIFFVKYIRLLFFSIFIYLHLNTLNVIFLNIIYSIGFLLYDLLSKSSKKIFLINILNILLFFIFKNLFKKIYFYLLIYISFEIFLYKIYSLNNLLKFIFINPYISFFKNINFNKRYDIIKNNYNKNKKTIVYFAGLFQKSDKCFRYMSKELNNYNHIYINLHIRNNDNFENILHKIFYELNGIKIECFVGYSFGGSLILQLKGLFLKDRYH